MFKYEVLLRNLYSQKSEIIEVHADVTTDQQHSEVLCRSAAARSHPEPTGVTSLDQQLSHRRGASLSHPPGEQLLSWQL